MLLVFCFERKSLQQADQPVSGFFSWGDHKCPTKEENLGEEGSPCKPKSLNFPLLLDKNITYWGIPHIGKNGISNSF